MEPCAKSQHDDVTLNAEVKMLNCFHVSALLLFMIYKLWLVAMLSDSVLLFINAAVGKGHRTAFQQMADDQHSERARLCLSVPKQGCVE